MKKARIGTGRSIGALWVSMLAIAVIVVGGCAAASPAGPSQASSATRPKVPEATVQVRGLVLPFDTYELSFDEIDIVSAAKDVLVRDCMKQRGYSWQVVRKRASVPDLRNRRRYGVVEHDVARTFGYHVTSALLVPPGIGGALDERDSRLSQEQEEAALDPDTGCDRQATEQLRRGADTDTALFTKLNVRSFASSKRASDVVRATREWRTCMDDRGFDYKTPDAASSDKAWSSTSRPSRKELAVATADVACKERTDLVKVWFAREKTIQDAAIRKHRGYFTELGSDKVRQVSAARAALEHHSRGSDPPT